MKLERLRAEKWLQIWLMFCALALPVAGYCDAGPGWLQRISASMGGHADDVAVKVAELPEKYKADPVRGIAFSADGSQIAVDSDHELINIWDWRNGRIVKTIEKAPGADDGLTTEPLHYSPTGKLFVACHAPAIDYIVARIWDTSTWSIAHDIQDSSSGACSAIGFTPDGQYLVRVVERVDSPGDSLIVYKVGTWQLLWGIQAERFSAKTLSISPDGEFIALGGTFYYTPPGLTSIVEKAQQTRSIPQIHIVDMRQRKVVRVIPGDSESMA